MQDLNDRVTFLEFEEGIEVELAESVDPGAQIVAIADRVNAGLMVIGTRGISGVERLLLGSTAEKIVRHSDHPVLTVTPTTVVEDETAAPQVALVGAD